MHRAPEAGTPPSADVGPREVAALYAGDPLSLVRPSLVDGMMSVLAPLDGARPLRCTADGSARCWRDHLAWFSHAPVDAADARARLDAVEARMEAVRTAEREGLSLCVRARAVGAVGTFGCQLAVLGGVAALLWSGHDAAAEATAALVPLPYLALLAAGIAGRRHGPGR